MIVQVRAANKPKHHRSQIGRQNPRPSIFDTPLEVTTMTPDWETNCVLVANLLRQRFPAVFRRLQAILSDHGIALKEVGGNRDIWIRDAAPVQVATNEFVQFRYQPDYLHGYKDLITPPKAFSGLSFIKKLQNSKLVIYGGNIVGTASTAILTDKVFAENPNRNPDEVENELKRVLQVERVIFIPQEPNDAIGHSDGMVRFIDENVVVVNDYSKIDRKFGTGLRSLLKGHGLKSHLLPYQIVDCHTGGIDSAVGNFVNYLRVGDLFIVPNYGIPDDHQATLKLRTLCPKATVLPLDCRKLAKKGGVLNCVTWTIRQAELFQVQKI